MSEKKFRVVVIGAGSRANLVIYPSLADLEDVEIAAICDIDEARLNETADRYHVEKRYGKSVVDYQRMIEEVKPDAVFAIGQPHIFYDIWTWCLNHGCNLYIEKPMGLNVHQARALEYLARTNGSITQVSFQRRSTPVVEKMREKCLEKGPITYAMCKFYKCEMTPFLGARDHMYDDCVHSIDTLRWICGGEIVSIESILGRIGVPDINFITAQLKFDNGSTGYLVNNWSSGKRIFSVEMHAPGIYAEVEHETGGRLYADGDLEGVEYSAAKEAGSDAFHVYTGVRKLVRNFVDCCRSGEQPLSNFSSALKTMEAAEKILAQGLLAE